MRVAHTVGIALFASVATAASAAVTTSVVDIPTRNVSERVLYLAPERPVANLVVLVGGDGRLKLRPDGSGETDLLVTSAPSRVRELFARAGYAVAVVDAPTDLQNTSAGVGTLRESPLHVADLLEVIRFMRARADVPVWLVGESTGGTSAMFAALNLPPDQPVGAVLLGAPAYGINGIRGLPLRDVRRPVEIVSHAADPCANLADQTMIFEDLESTPAKEHVVLTGGNAAGYACNGGYHQFEGLDNELVGAITGFAAKYGSLIAPVPATAAAVEFYHAALDHYFLTWVGDEIAALDAGTAIQGWTRTGRSFPVFRDAQAGTSPVCRFYIPPALGNSHFYGRGTAECEATAQQNPSFVLEDPRFMHVALPAAGSCPAGTTPVYRVFSNRPDANHRYTTDRALRDEMVARGWLAEGDGPDLVVMCAPA